MRTRNFRNVSFKENQMTDIFIRSHPHALRLRQDMQANACDICTLISTNWCVFSRLFLLSHVFFRSPPMTGYHCRACDFDVCVVCSEEERVANPIGAVANHYPVAHHAAPGDFPLLPFLVVVISSDEAEDNDLALALALSAADYSAASENSFVFGKHVTASRRRTERSDHHIAEVPPAGLDDSDKCTTRFPPLPFFRLD